MAGWEKETESRHRKGQQEKPEKRGLSVEQKLRLSHMLRQEEDYNRMQMDQREMLVYGVKNKSRRYGAAGLKSGYGRTSMLQAAELDEEQQDIEWQKIQRRNRISFMVRGFFSVLLFVIVLLMRFSGLRIGSVDYQNLVDSLSSEEFINGIDFEELIPYTDKEQVLPEQEDEPSKEGDPFIEDAPSEEGDPFIEDAPSEEGDPFIEDVPSEEGEPSIEDSPSDGEVSSTEDTETAGNKSTGEGENLE